jgi:membrane-associated phospholipid phosphatase
VPAASRPRWALISSWVAGLAVLAIVTLTIAIHSRGPILGVDVATLDLVNRIRTPWLVDIFSVLTWAGDFLVASLALVVACAVVALRRRERRPLWLGLAAVGLLAASVGTGKQVIARSRIPFAAGSFGDGGTSYPSGHATTAVVVGGCLVLLAAPALSVARRRVAWCAMVGYAVLVGVSRLYLRQHWLSDVLVGWLLGTAIVCVLAVAFFAPPTRWAGQAAADRG